MRLEARRADRPPGLAGPLLAEDRLDQERRSVDRIAVPVLAVPGAAVELDRPADDLARGGLSVLAATDLDFVVRPIEHAVEEVPHVRRRDLHPARIDRAACVVQVERHADLLAL